MNGKTMPPLALAYLGDALMSVKVREYILECGYMRPVDFQRLSVRFVSAKAQASFVHELLEQGFFTEEEETVLKRGRNAKSLTVPKNTDVITYKMATALEALWGYLYCEGKLERIEELWNKIKEMRSV
ncbi:MAG: ribonuclease III [Erysipelotrichaceae bacterium]|nr:ribonuclease III [Erysipelotrichaceae bacterium]MBQ9987031.1 ribonuclease III [Erysipelotrichales bacterium]MBR3693922.1 ribonuclease III [Erysipelotrichales bacterium]